MSETKFRNGALTGHTRAAWGSLKESDPNNNANKLRNYRNHRDEYKAKMLAYYYANREQINAKLREKRRLAREAREA